MGVSMGKGGGSAVADINMTPMIDVLLVLLVIFIIVQMNLQRSFDIQLPVDTNDPGPPNPNNIIMEIDANGAISINTQQVQASALEARLKEIYDPRPDKIIFVKADPRVKYQQVIAAIDAARAAGVLVVGAVLPPPTAAVTGS